MSDLITLNDNLNAKSKNVAASTDLQSLQDKAYEAYVTNNATVLGRDIYVTDMGVLTLDANTGNTPITVDLINQILPDADFMTVTSVDQLQCDVATGNFTLVGSAPTFSTYVMDSAGGQPLADSAGDLIEAVVSGSELVPTITSTGTDAVQTINETMGSLTGITPPDESITIIALGGSAIDEITNTVKVAAERKNSLMSQIKSTAAAASASGLGESITEGLDNITSTMDETINSAKGELEAEVLGAVSAVEGFADDVAAEAGALGNGLISGITSTVGEVTNAITDGFNDVIDAVGDAAGDLLNSVTTDISTGFGFAQDLFEDLTGTVGSTLQGLFGSSTALDKDFISGIIKDVLAGGDINLTKAAKSLALKDESLSPEMKEVIQGTNATSIQELNSQVQSRARARGIPESQITQFSSTSSNIETALSQVDTTIAGTLVSEVGEFYTEDTDLAELVKRYLGADTETFEYVDSKEELGLEFRKMTRPISEVIVHATETYTNANIGSEEIHLRHNEAGHDGIQYHYVIRRDGRLQRGMPLDDISAASDILGHSLNCIDIVLVGGVNVPSDADNPLLNLSSSSFTQSQMKTLEAVLDVFYKRMPGGQVLGHNSIDLNSQDPYFDVISFVENKFGKKSVYTDPLTESSISPKDLISKRPV